MMAKVHPTVYLAMAILAACARLSAESIVEHSAEARFQLDLHVPDAALAAFLPAGWMPNIAAQGAAKDANFTAEAAPFHPAVRRWLAAARRAA